MTFDDWKKSVILPAHVMSSDEFARVAFESATKIEREVAAMVCDGRSKRKNDGNYADSVWEAICIANELAADEIRARGDK